jgi:hypothetical protein
MNGDFMLGTGPWLWFGFTAVVGVAFWIFVGWLAWVLVQSVKGIREELAAIRRILDAG